MDISSSGVAIRRGTDPSLRRRRRIAALAGFAVADFLVGSLYQTGVVRRLPDPRLRGVDSMAIMGTRAAYPFGVPDAPIAAAFNALVMAAAVARGTEREGRPPAADLVLGAMVAGGALAALGYAGVMVQQRRACVYCIAAATAMIAMVPLAAPLVRGAIRRLFG